MSAPSEPSDSKPVAVGPVLPPSGSEYHGKFIRGIRDLEDEQVEYVHRLNEQLKNCKNAREEREILKAREAARFNLIKLYKGASEL